MSKITELREKRAKVWEQAKAFLDERRGEDDLLSAEDAATYEKMETEVVNLGKEIERLERQAALDLELSQATSQALKTVPGVGEKKQGRATDEYTRAFWKHMRNRGDFEVRNALTIGTDSEGGYLVPDEFERTLIEALEEENIMRQLAKVITTSSGDKKIPVVASKGTAAWVDEEGTIPEDDDAFGQVSIGAYKVATMIKVSEELLNDSIFNLESYIAREFARRIGAKEEEAFLVGDGSGKPAGIFDDTHGGEIGVTTSTANIKMDEIFDLFYSLKSPSLSGPTSTCFTPSLVLTPEVSILFFKVPVLWGASCFIACLTISPASRRAWFSILLPLAPSFSTSAIRSSIPSSFRSATSFHLQCFNLHKPVLVFDIVNGDNVVLSTLKEYPHRSIKVRQISNDKLHRIFRLNSCGCEIFPAMQVAGSRPNSFIILPGFYLKAAFVDTGS